MFCVTPSKYVDRPLQMPEPRCTGSQQYATNESPQMYTFIHEIRPKREKQRNAEEEERRRYQTWKKLQSNSKK